MSAAHQSMSEVPVRKPTLLATSRAVIIKNNGDKHVVRILIDQGSELSFIAEDVVLRLQVERKAASVPLLGIGGTFSGRTKGVVTIQLQSIYDQSSMCTITAFILPRLTAKLPPFDAHSSWPHITGLQLADPDFSRSGYIQLIIGADNYGSVIMKGLIKGKDLNSPLAQQTIFGWVISGPISTDDVLIKAYGYHCAVDDDLQRILTKFWTQEELPLSTPATLNPDEMECEQHFLTTHTRDDSGRYIVRLPMKSTPTDLGDSRSIALRCLNRLVKRLSTDALYNQRYVDFIEEYKELGHMVRVQSTEEAISPIYYLPHHGVLREHSITTKLRVVFNGSSRSSNGVSLNDILHAGAKLQVDIFDVLLWTRMYRFTFSTDITKMFRQIAIHPDDWNLQRIIWQEDNNRLVDYHLTTVTYGLTCAPFLALRTLQQLITDEGQRYPKAVAPLTKGRYVDDIFGGADTIAEAQEIIRQLYQLCMAGGFPLQKWKSNCVEILTDVQLSSEEAAATVEIEPTFQKILGLIWQPVSDTFHFTVQPPIDTQITKRIILSEIARLYDPLGLISPVLIRAKIILQELWLHKISWDESLSPELHHRWELFRQQLAELNKLTIPRWIGTIRSNITVEIHGFSDASHLAMAAAVYVRVHCRKDEISVHLVCSKTRVAPLKRLTIPRLELAAALLLARLVAHCLQALELSHVPVHLWTDSSVALTWITAHPSRWKDFVRNRVSAIQEALPSGSWRFVPGKENPADCASRGMRPDQLQHHELWWKGPRWLAGPQSSWPLTFTKPAPEAELEERPGHAMVAVSQPPSYWNILDKYSSLTKLLRITAICRRFYGCLRHVPQSSLINPLIPMELEQSLMFWIKIVQQAWFSNDIRSISKGEQLPRSNALVRLTPFIDRDGLLRVGGRLHHANIDPETKHPLILPRNSPLTKLIIANAHEKTLHGGTQVTLGFIRRSHWILGGRAPVRSYILKCVRCARYRGTRAQQLMGQLPASRVTPTRPFYNSGVDYAGPVTLKTWRGRAARSYKGYLAIFVCLATSAIHLELVTDYTTEAFIAAYKRFTGRRGICATLQSDCGTNFVGADSALRQRFESTSTELRELASLLANDGTKWMFNPPSAPHFGGKWEAAVKSTKYHLLRVIGDTILTYEELTTVLTQIEAVLNSRPLCPLSDDANDYTALTPGHFLIGEALTTIPEPNLLSEPISRLSRWQLLRQKVDHFWSRWSTECLQRYQAISKWHHPSTNIKEGSMVLVSDERYPPAKWPLARITQLHPGPDGLTRVVTLRTHNSTFKRPIAKLCVLPIDPHNTNSTTLLSKAGGNV